MTVKAIETRKCEVDGCEAKYCCKGYCRLHWERQHETGTTDDPKPRTGSLNPAWKGDAATYGAVHLRMSNGQRPESCEACGATDTKFEWALRGDVDRAKCLRSPAGYAYSTNPSDYANLCKPCHNTLDLGRDECRRGHPLSGDNLYIQPSNDKRFCVACSQIRRRKRQSPGGRW